MKNIKTIGAFFAALFFLYLISGCKKTENSSPSFTYSFNLKGHTFSGTDSVSYQVVGEYSYFEVVGESYNQSSTFRMLTLSLDPIPYGPSSSTELFECFLNLNTDSEEVLGNDLTFHFTTSTSTELEGNFSGMAYGYINSVLDSAELTNGHFAAKIGN